MNSFFNSLNKPILKTLSISANLFHAYIKKFTAYENNVWKTLDKSVIIRDDVIVSVKESKTVVTRNLMSFLCVTTIITINIKGLFFKEIILQITGKTCQNSISGMTKKIKVC